MELNIVPVNDAPTATFDVDQTVAENSNALTGLLTSIDVDGNDGTTFALVSAAVDGADPVTEVSGLTIAPDGNWNFDPKDPAYNALAEGESQVITITYQVSDDAGASGENSFSITVTGTNDSPVATFTEAQSTTEDALEPVTGQLTATDVDNNSTFSYALVGAPIDGLSITADGTWSFDSSHPTYQGLTEGQNLDINVTYSVTDNNLASAQNTFVISLTGTNDGPQLSGLPSALPGGSEDNPYTITKAQLLAGFSDADEGETQLLDVLNLQATDDQGQPVGSFTLNANGTSWSFSPNPNFNGTVTLNYNVSDGTAETAATNSFALASVNDIPELTGVKATLANGTEDLTYTISAADLLTGYTDADIDNDADSTQALSILGLSATGGFIADNGDGTYSFSPNPDVNGVITLNYVVSDGAGGNTLATNSFSLDAVNDLPIRTAGNVSTLFLLEDQAIASMGLSGLSYSVGGGTDETDAQTLTYSVDGLPEAAIGTVFLADGETAITAGEELTLEQLQGLQFLAAPNASGQAEFSFQVSDGVGSITETIALDILNFNDTPVLPADAITLIDGSEDIAYTFSAADLLTGVTDVDVDADGVADVDNLEVINLSVTNGELSYDPDTTTYTFQPDANFNGIARFNYSITDNNGGTVSNTVELNIVPVNDAPELSGLPSALPGGSEDQPYTITKAQLLAGYNDVDGDKLDIAGGQLALINPNQGVIEGNPNDGWIFTPAADFNGNIDFSYTITDGNGSEIPATNSFALAAVNDIPELTGVKATLANGTEDLIYTITAEDLLTGFTDADIDNDADSTQELSILGLSATDGVITDNGDGTYSFSPNPDVNGDITLNYLVTDGAGGNTIATNTFSLEAINDLPEIEGELITTDANGNEIPIFRDINEDGAEGLLINQDDLLGAYKDVDGNLLAVNNLALQDPTAGTLTLTADGNYQFTPAADFNGLATFTYEISDGNASIQQSYFITVNPINDAPVGTSKTIDVTSGEFVTLSPDDFGFKDIIDRDVLENVILDLTSFTPTSLKIGETLNTDAIGTKLVSYDDLANGLVSIQGGAMSTTLEIRFKVQDDQGTENGGLNTDSEWRTLSVYAIPPASDDVEIINRIRVTQALRELESRLQTVDEKEGFSNTVELAGALSSEKREEFLGNYDAGMYNSDPFKAKRFIQANMSSDSLAADKTNLEDQVNQLDPNDDADRIAELQAQIEALNETITKLDNGDLLPKLSLIDDLVGADGEIDFATLSASIAGSDGNSILKGADDATATEFAVSLGSSEVSIDKDELNSLLAAQKENESYQEALRSGFADTAEGKKAATEAQLKSIAAAKEFEVSTDSAAYEQASLVFLSAGVSMGDLLELGDPELIAQAKAMASDPDKAKDAEIAKADLEKLVNPFGGGAITITAADIVKKANQTTRTLDLSQGLSGSELDQYDDDVSAGNVFSEEADVLGTTDLAETNAAFIGALDGSIEGQDGLTFNADSKVAVFKFRYNKETGKGQKIVSYLSGNADVFEADGQTLSSKAQEETAGLEEGTYDKYLKFVSQYDLLAYGATLTGETDPADDKPLFTWDDPNGIKTADGNPLTLLSGETIIKEGWYDFTQTEEGGDGARYIINDAGRVVGVELNFTANMFGDKEPGDDFITDPGATVGTETRGNGKIEEGEVAINEVELQVLRDFAAEAVLLEDDQQIVSSNAVILQDGEIAITKDAVTESSQEEVISSFAVGDGIDAAGNSFADPLFTGLGESNQNLSMTTGEGPGQTDFTGDGQSSSSASGEGEGESALAQEVNEFIQGDGEGGFDAEASSGQNAPGQGQGSGGEAALGEDQSPETQRKRGLMLQPLMAVDNEDDTSKTPSSLLKNLSEGSLMGNNLLDALTLGAGVLYALYAPKAVDVGKKGWRKFFDNVRNKSNGESAVIAEKNVLSVFAMKMPNGAERLMATRVGMGGMEVLAQQDLPSDVNVGDPGNDTQLDYSVSQLLAKLEGQSFDLALIGPKLYNQSALVQELAQESQLLDTQKLINRLNNCTSTDIQALQQWLNKPSSTPPESSPVFSLLQERQKQYGNDLAPGQASMSSLVELSVAMGWSQYSEAV